MVLRSSTTVWWPGISVDIGRVQELCHSMCENTPSQQHMPPTELVQAGYPFQKWFLLSDILNGQVCLSVSKSGEWRASETSSCAVLYIRGSGGASFGRDQYLCVSHHQKVFGG